MDRLEIPMTNVPEKKRKTGDVYLQKSAEVIRKGCWLKPCLK